MPRHSILRLMYATSSLYLLILVSFLGLATETIASLDEHCHISHQPQQFHVACQYSRATSQLQSKDKSIRQKYATLVSSRALRVRGGGSWLIPAGWNPLGYGSTRLGDEFLQFQGSLDSDVGRFLASLKKKRKTRATIKDEWIEIVRASKQGQMMRIYRSIDELISFCLKAGLID